MRWLSQNYGTVLHLTLEHLAVSALAVLASLVIAVPLGWLAHQRRWLRGPLTATAGLLYAVPSLPLLVLAPVLLGTSLRSAVNLVAVLAVYGVAILVRSAADAFASVPATILTSATAVGYTRWRRFWSVELPLAGPVILAGLRVVVVSTVSLVTIGSLIGIRSLGTLFADGFQRGIEAEVLTGLALTAAIALALDAGCRSAGRRLMPWTLHPPVEGTAP